LVPSIVVADPTQAFQIDAGAAISVAVDYARGVHLE
jgi:hypothetical protein